MAPIIFSALKGPDQRPRGGLPSKGLVRPLSGTGPAATHIFRRLRPTAIQIKPFGFGMNFTSPGSFETLLPAAPACACPERQTGLNPELLQRSYAFWTAGSSCLIFQKNFEWGASPTCLRAARTGRHTTQRVKGKKYQSVISPERNESRGS